MFRRGHCLCTLSRVAKGVENVHILPAFFIFDYNTELEGMYNSAMPPPALNVKYNSLTVTHK